MVVGCLCSTSTARRKEPHKTSLPTVGAGGRCGAGGRGVRGIVPSLTASEHRGAAPAESQRSVAAGDDDLLACAVCSSDCKRCRPPTFLLGCLGSPHAPEGRVEATIELSKYDVTHHTPPHTTRGGSRASSEPRGTCQSRRRRGSARRGPCRSSSCSSSCRPPSGP